MISPDFLHSDAPLDFDRLRFAVVPGGPLRRIPGRQAALEDDIRNLCHEFAGQGELALIHAMLCVGLRRDICSGLNFARYQTLWQDHADWLTEALDLGWLVSACDTFADLSPDPSERQLALMGSLFANTVNLYETERRLTRPAPLDRSLLDWDRPLVGGMTPFVPGGGDMVRNLVERIDRMEVPAGPVSAIMQAVIGRVLRGETIFSRLRSVQLSNQRWPSALSQSAFPGRSPSAWGAATHAPAGFVLLNDTGRLSGGFHCGTVMACAALRDGLTSRGITEQGWANDTEGFDRLLSRLSQRPRLVVLNGEGTLHHDAARAIRLLECCAKAAAAGIPVAVVNSVWQANGSTMGQLLQSADLVHVRESASLAALPPAVTGRITPDMSFLAFSRLYDGATAHAVCDLGVIDSVRAPIAHALQDFAGRAQAALYAMPRHMVTTLRQRCAQFPEAAAPALLTAPDLLTSARWVTGRYHGLIAALAAGKPVCATPSNTHKIEAMLGDAGLSAALLPADWETLEPKDQDAAIDAAFGAQDQDFIARRTAYTADAVARIEAMFDDLAALAQG